MYRGGERRVLDGAEAEPLLPRGRFECRLIDLHPRTRWGFGGDGTSLDTS